MCQSDCRNQVDAFTLVVKIQLLVNLFFFFLPAHQFPTDTKQEITFVGKKRGADVKVFSSCYHAKCSHT